MQTTEENQMPITDRLRSFHLAGTISWEQGKALAGEAADEIEDLQGRNFVNRNAIKFMREKLDRQMAEIARLREENRCLILVNEGLKARPGK